MRSCKNNMDPSQPTAGQVLHRLIEIQAEDNSLSISSPPEGEWITWIDLEIGVVTTINRSADFSTSAHQNFK